MEGVSRMTSSFKNINYSSNVRYIGSVFKTFFIMLRRVVALSSCIHYFLRWINIRVHQIYEKESSKTLSIQLISIWLMTYIWWRFFRRWVGHGLFQYLHPFFSHLSEPRVFLNIFLEFISQVDVIGFNFLHFVLPQKIEFPNFFDIIAWFQPILTPVHALKHHSRLT